MEQKYRSKTLGHLGLVSGMIDELGLVEAIDNCVQTDGVSRDVSIGLICKALILNGLGFSQRTLYMVSSFFLDKPMESLLGADVSAEQLNDTVLGRALDVIHAYGCTELYGTIAPRICDVLGLKTKVAHMDSTDFHLDGVYNSREEEVDPRLIHLRPGYSRDHRPDLNQAVLNPIVENEAGIVLHMQGLNGNTSDKTAFNNTIKEHIGQLKSVHNFNHIVMDSAGYTEKMLKDCAALSVKWITRVPETLNESKSVVSTTHANWTPLAPGYEYVALNSNHATIDQRWLLVFSQEAYERELITLKKKYGKESEKECRAFSKLSKGIFDCEQDAQTAANNFVLKCKYLSVNHLIIKKVPFFDKQGRPKNGEAPSGHRFFIEGTVCCQMDDFDKMARSKGKFIIATNDLDVVALPDNLLFAHYKEQSKVERGFRFLKDPQFMASTLFVKKPERVEALLFIMTLCLSVYAALEYRMRQELKKQGLTLPNQLGKEVKNPTARWVFACFSGIHVLHVNQKSVILNLNPFHLKVLDLLGNNYRKYYAVE